MTKVSVAADSRRPLVSFVIPVRDDAVRLAACLASIASNEYDPASVEVVVVDNGSTDGSRQVSSRAGATVIDRPGAPVAQLRNAGAAAARGSILAFVDADHAIDPRWIQRVVEALVQADVGAVGALCRAPAGGTWVQHAYDRLRARRSRREDVEWLGSGNLAVRRDVLDAIGGFDASLETCEDVDLCRRIRARRLRVVSDPRLVNIHFGDPQTLVAVFRGELWRGRDNLRVSARQLSWRMLPSVAIPVIDLGLAALAIAGATAMSKTGAVVSVLACACMLLLAALRPVRAALTTSGGLLEFGQALAVSCAYDLGRACALIVPSGHDARRAGQHA